MNRELRTEPRESVNLSLSLGDGRTGVTRDISASGIYFQMEGLQRVGALIEFEIDMQGEPVKLCAQGEIVRIDPAGGKTGIAVRLRESRLLPVT